MKYNGMWFGDHLGAMSFGQFSKEVDSTFPDHPNKGEMIAELYALFQLRRTEDNSTVKTEEDHGNDSVHAEPVREP